MHGNFATFVICFWENKNWEEKIIESCFIIIIVSEFSSSDILGYRTESRRNTRLKVVIGARREKERKGLEETVRAVGGETDKMIKQDKMVHTYLSDTYGKGIIPNI